MACGFHSTMHVQQFVAEIFYNYPILKDNFINWCPEEDSNLHIFRYRYLKPARLPIPPSGQLFMVFE
jgi:hypothetical protein